MSCRMLAATALAAALLGAGAVHAQMPPARVTDVGPPPAEERDSTGAVVLEKSLVRAQRDKAFDDSSARTGVGSIGRGVVRGKMAAPPEGDLARARNADADYLRQYGAGGMIAK